MSKPAMSHISDYLTKLATGLTLAAVTGLMIYIYDTNQELTRIVEANVTTKRDHLNMFNSLSDLNKALASTNEEIAFARSSLTNLNSLVRDLDLHVNGLQRENIELRLRLDTLERRLNEFDRRGADQP